MSVIAVVARTCVSDPQIPSHRNVHLMWRINFLQVNGAALQSGGLLSLSTDIHDRSRMPQITCSRCIPLIR